MYNTSLYLYFSSTTNNQNIVKMFFEDWADTICNKQVKYSVITADSENKSFRKDIIRIDFENEEDAIVLKLKGIPEEFQKHLKFLNWND